jgi:ribosome-associated protein
MRKVVNFCDYFVICSGNTDRQVKAVADEIEDGLKEIGVRISKRSGDRRSNWVVLDLGDIIAHVFEKNMREFYALEHLWNDAKKVKWQGNEA